MTLESFAPNSRSHCCATCEHWTLRKPERKTIVWCPVLSCELVGRRIALGCDEWSKEPHESFAIALYDALIAGGAS